MSASSNADRVKWSYVFLLKPNMYGVHVDSMLDVSKAVMEGSFKDYLTTARVIDRIDGTNTALNEYKELLHQVEMLSLRSRLDGACEGPFLLHSEVELSYDTLEQMVHNNPKFVKHLMEKARL